MSKSKKDIVFIINPISGGKRKPDNIEKVIIQTITKNFDVYIEFTTGVGHASELTKAYLQKGFQEFVAVGGDGTLNEIAKELLNTDANLNIIPMGSGNGLARHLKIYSSKFIDHLNRIIHSHEVLKIDTGQINGHLFLCTAGIGFDAEVASVFNKSKGRGLRNYMLATLKTFQKFKSFEVNIGDKSEQIFSLTFANASQFGNNALIAPAANISDGLLEYCLIKPFPIYQLPALTYHLFNGSLQNSNNYHFQTFETLTVNCDRVNCIHCDGETIPLVSNTVKVNILPQSLNIRL